MIGILFGMIDGFVLYLGPIILGLIGLISGIIIGVLVDFYSKKKVHKKQ